MNKTNLGQFGETLAAKYLARKGYRIIEQNFRIRGGEIDIIAVDGNTLVYIEVKTRTGNQFGYPEEAVTPQKIKFLERAAKFYRLKRKNLPDLERIDVLALDLSNHNNPQFTLFKNASF
jgi:putative endonuclease